MELFNKIEETTRYIRAKVKGQYEVGIILGTGLGTLADQIAKDEVMDYEALPHFPLSTVETHAGKLIFGQYAKKNVVAMQGRFHLYEGYSVEEITFPVRVMKALGVKYLIVSNACGGLNPLFKAGSIMVTEDHINLLGQNPLMGKNDERLGPRFPDMIEPYSKRLQKIALQVALHEGIQVAQGVYVALPGPCLETRAEYRFLRIIGADVVGMSTVPEVIVAVHAGLEVLGLSVITDLCLPDALKPINITEIIATAKRAEKNLIKIIKGTLHKI